MSVPQPRNVRRADANYFGPNHDAVAALVARISAAGPERMSAIAATPSGTAYLTALGAAWRATRKAGVSKQVERSSEAAFAAAPGMENPTTERKAVDALANAAIATALGSKLAARYAELLLAPAALLDSAD